MTLELNTTKHCIETAAKKSYEKLLRQAFKQEGSSSASRTLENQIELLKTFLEQADARKLRSLYPELDKGGAAKVELLLEGPERSLALAFNQRKILVPLKDSS